MDTGGDVGGAYIWNLQTSPDWRHVIGCRHLQIPQHDPAPVSATNPMGSPRVSSNLILVGIFAVLAYGLRYTYIHQS